MNKLFLYLLVIFAIVLIDAKKHRKQNKIAVTEETNVIQTSVSSNNQAKEDPCVKLKCTAGKECIINHESGEAKCQCIGKCADNTDMRRRVCSNVNTTWQSDCHLFRHRCLCLEDSTVEDCNEEHKHLHIEYYGECQLLPECKKEVLEDFPRRLREWLYNIMSKKLHLSKNDEIDHLTHKWIDAVIWKFCDLDKQPSDRHISRHELFPLRAPLLSMETCISNFLDNCDSNNDHKITLVEWGQCLGATDAEIEDKCIQFKALQESDQ